RSAAASAARAVAMALRLIDRITSPPATDRAVGSEASVRGGWSAGHPVGKERFRCETVATKVAVRDPVSRYLPHR
ncbi:MAG: hypothetical protein L0221_10970, partial [Chloroflexi bacterium]|nr:hypothetical protein [Chloroflexota bacterium]